MNLGPAELIIILVIVLLLFGSKKLPELARSIGTSLKELRSGVSDDPQPKRTVTKEETNNQE